MRFINVLLTYLLTYNVEPPPALPIIPMFRLKRDSSAIRSKITKTYSATLTTLYAQQIYGQLTPQREI